VKVHFSNTDFNILAAFNEASVNKTSESLQLDKLASMNTACEKFDFVNLAESNWAAVNVDCANRESFTTNCETIAALKFLISNEIQPSSRGEPVPA